SYMLSHFQIRDDPTPILTNINYTPNKKKKECCKSVFRTCFVCCPCNSFTLIPVIYDKYAGKIGRSQGERNDNAPAPNAKIIPTNKNVSVLISAISYILSTLII